MWVTLKQHRCEFMFHFLALFHRVYIVNHQHRLWEVYQLKSNRFNVVLCRHLKLQAVAAPMLAILLMKPTLKLIKPIMAHNTLFRL